MSKSVNSRCRLCNRHKRFANADCKGSGVVHPLPPPLPSRPPEQ